MATKTKGVGALRKQAQQNVKAAEKALADAEAAIQAAQTANAEIIGLGGEPVDLGALGSTRSNARAMNPNSLPMSILIAMNTEPGAEWRGPEIHDALLSGGYKTTAQERSFRTSIAQALGKMVAGEIEGIPASAVKRTSHGVYVLQARGKTLAKGLSLKA